MITVCIDRDACSLRMDGHAEYAEPGQDIVCAAATILAYALAQRLSGIAQARIDMAEGHAYIQARANGDTLAALDTVACGFELLAAKYPENIRYR